MSAGARRTALLSLVIAAWTFGPWVQGVAQTNPPAATETPASANADANAAAPASVPSSQRQSLLPLAQPLWSELKPAEQTVLAPLSGQWNVMALDEKRSWITLAARFPKMTPEQQTHASARIRELAKLTPDQRRLARANYRLAKTLPQQERLAQSEQYQNMTDEQKKVLQTSGTTSNTGARHAGARTALAKEASQPLPTVPRLITTPAPIRGAGENLPVNSLQPNRN